MARTAFEESFPSADLLEAASMVRAGVPNKWLLMKTVSSALGSISELYDGIPVPQPVFGSATAGSVAASMMTDARMADEIERLVGLSKTVSAPAAGSLPQWLQALIPILLQLLSGLWNRPSIVPVP